MSSSQILTNMPSEAGTTDLGKVPLNSWLSKRSRQASVLCLLALLAACGGGGGGSGSGGESEAATLAAIIAWNQIAVDASGLDHAPPNVGPPHQQHQLGPTRSSRAMAIVHIATFEAMLAIRGGYQSYLSLPQVVEETSVLAGIAQAAHDTLVALFPSQSQIMATHLADALSEVPDDAAKTRGIALGQATAQAILDLRANDQSDLPEPVIGVNYWTSNAPGRWRQDPISQIPVALGANWSMVTPFALQSANQFRTPPPPPLPDGEYTACFDEVKALGGDGVVTPTVRSEQATQVGIYWAYDGTPSLCAPPRLYNQIARQITQQIGANAMETSRFLAVLNIALADAGIGSWESKYFYDFWRPVGGVREADAGFGPTGIGDGNPATVCDPTFVPLAAPATNTTGPNFTPPFPAYPSGHATFGGALFQCLRQLCGTDEIEFTFVSDEYNGVTRDIQGQVRPLLPRTFQNLSEAEEENGQSRIYLGIHWNFDKTAGIDQGRQIADYVMSNIYLPK